jgi:heterodisulfide reductase subunit A
MPAWADEIEAALQEGIIIENGWGPQRIVTDAEGEVAGIIFKRCTQLYNAQGAFAPLYDEGERQQVLCRMVLVAIGQRPDISWASGSSSIPLDERGYLPADPLTFATERPGLFAGGEISTGPSLVVRAVANGYQAALSIERYLSGQEVAKERPATPQGQNWNPLEVQTIHPAPRAQMPLLPHEARHDFSEVELGFSEAQATTEAARCVSCGSCAECMLCVSRCKAEAIDHGQRDERLEIEVGAVVVATGFDLLDPSPLKAYGYGTHPNVLTSLEFERLCNATGPTAGKILLREKEGHRLQYSSRAPQSVAILHCIGSRDIRYHRYCSRTCCMIALKYAHLLKDRIGHEVAVYNFYIDMRCFGKGYEEFYQRVQEEGVRMIRGKAARITTEAETEEEQDKLIVVAEDTLSARLLRVPVEMAILCSAMEARKDAPQLARLFGLSLGSDGFFLEEHPKLEPVSTPTAGIFIAGACQGPKDIPDAVAQAKAAAGAAQALLCRGEVEGSPMFSEIDPDLCVGCQVCLGLCPYSAIEFDPGRHRSRVNGVICKGCGSCAAYCPSGAAKVRHFNDRQVLHELQGLLGYGAEKK